MARYTDAKCRMCRREGTKLFLKGARCYSEKCAMNRRNQRPGQHGAGRTRVSDFGRHLREKQKVKRMYGVLEAQFRRYYDKASKVKGVTGQMLLQMLERRLDSVLLYGGGASSRGHARQLVRQGKVLVNGNKVTIPSYELSAGDEVSWTSTYEGKTEQDLPVWIKKGKGEKAIVVDRLPERDDISMEINEQLIVEYYSR